MATNAALPHVLRSISTHDNLPQHDPMPRVPNNSVHPNALKIFLHVFRVSSFGAAVACSMKNAAPPVCSYKISLVSPGVKKVGVRCGRRHWWHTVNSQVQQRFGSELHHFVRVTGLHSGPRVQKQLHRSIAHNLIAERGCCRCQRLVINLQILERCCSVPADRARVDSACNADSLTRTTSCFTSLMKRGMLLRSCIACYHGEGANSSLEIRTDS